MQNPDYNTESRKSEPEGNGLFYEIQNLPREKLDTNGNVIHIHGCIDDPTKFNKILRHHPSLLSSSPI